MTIVDLWGPMDGEIVQERFPGRYCDTCRAKGTGKPSLATHARDDTGGGRTFYCDSHLPMEHAPEPPTIDAHGDILRVERRIL